MPLPQNHLDLPKPAYILSRTYFRPGKFSWASELRHFISGKFLNILWWPVFKFHQRWFTYSKLFFSCKNLPQFTDLWKTIQKGSFAYNTLFLKKVPFRRSDTDLADITTLTLFFGDEFIDGIAAEAGKPFILQLVQNDPRKFYLHTKIKSRQVSLQYQFDLYRL
ncbi:MAG TPA: hypothetical protein VNA26_01220, partial [Chitinophagaceae bacterium]|nr:hypothetical protein [Chitinophagaceae bacterium]